MFKRSEFLPGKFLELARMHHEQVKLDGLEILFHLWRVGGIFFLISVFIPSVPEDSSIFYTTDQLVFICMS